MVLPKVIAHQEAGRAQIVVCLDREQRPNCPGELAGEILKALQGELTSKGRTKDGVAVVVADRAFEAWILADARGLHNRRVFNASPKFHRFEGEIGERSMKGCVELSHLMGRPYSKTVDGPALFRKLDFGAARDHSKHGSKSLDKLLRTLGV